MKRTRKWIVNVGAFGAVTLSAVIIRSATSNPPLKPRLSTTLAFRKARLALDAELKETQPPYTRVLKLEDDKTFASPLDGGEPPLHRSYLQWPERSEVIKKVEPSNEELDQVHFWWNTLLDADNFIGDEDEEKGITSDVVFFNDEWKDDHGVGTRYVFSGTTIQILDRRDLVLIVEPVKLGRFGAQPTADMSQEQRLKSMEDYVGRVFRVVTQYNSQLLIRRHDLTFANTHAVGLGAQGKIKLVGDTPNWFLMPIDWWSDGKAVAFRLDKVTPTLGDKFGAKELEGRGHIYGYAQNDPRAFNRFDKNFIFDFDKEILKYKSEIEVWKNTTWFKPEQPDPSKPMVSNLRQEDLRGGSSSGKKSDKERLKLEAQEEENYQKNVLREE